MISDLQMGYAFFPRKMFSGKWIWFKTYWYWVDHRPEAYLGLLPEVYRFQDKETAKDAYIDFSR